MVMQPSKMHIQSLITKGLTFTKEWSSRLKMHKRPDERKEEQVDGWMDDEILRPLQQFFSHIRTVKR